MTDPFEAAGVRFDNSFVRDLQGLSMPFTPAIAPDPHQLALNAQLAAELGLEADALATPEGIAVLVGNLVPAGAQAVAQAYAGHQFGNYSPRLGDGRAVLLGEVIDVHGRRRDIHLKGSGRTPFSRGGDGKAAVGPMLREYVIGEAMYALGIPTTRMLAVTATGDKVMRDAVLPGAVLARVASSHLRVGSFQYAASLGDPSVVQDLADYAIARHYPDAADAENPYLAFFEAVLDAQASLVARWMLVGFIHGVLNTDNVTISGETIDYGPCAFMDAYDPMTVFSSIDQTGRYAYANQPLVTPWNLARLAEPLLPLIHSDQDTAIAKATAALETFAGRYEGYWLAGMRAKLGLSAGAAGATDTEDAALVAELLSMMHAQSADFTSVFRGLSNCLRGSCNQAHGLFGERLAFDDWHSRWLARVSLGDADLATVAAAMDAINPLYIPRNHLVEEALAAATGGDLEPFEDLLHVLASPFAERTGLERYTEPAPPGFGRYQTFCGT